MRCPEPWKSGMTRRWALWRPKWVSASDRIGLPQEERRDGGRESLRVHAQARSRRGREKLHFAHSKQHSVQERQKGRRSTCLAVRTRAHTMIRRAKARRFVSEHY